MTAPLLAVRGVKTFYGNIMALKGIDLDVNAGEIVTLIGANGAGKSTLMMTIFGNPRAAEGRIVFDGRDITHMPLARDREASDRAVAGRTAYFPAHDGAGKPADGRNRRRSRAFCRRPQAGLRAVSAAAAAHEPARRHACPAASSRCSPLPAR